MTKTLFCDRRASSSGLHVRHRRATANAPGAGAGAFGDAFADGVQPSDRPRQRERRNRRVCRRSARCSRMPISRVRVDGTTARGTFSLTGEALRAGVSRVTLLSGATVIEATQAGRPLPLVADGRQHAALVQGPGPFSVDLEWARAAHASPRARAVFVLPVPPAGAARATIDLPGDQADVRLSVGWITRRSTANGRTIVEATLDPGSATEVSWSMRDSAPVASARELRMTRRRDDDGDARRLGHPHGRAGRPDGGARRAAHRRGPPAVRLRADQASPATRSRRATCRTTS